MAENLSKSKIDQLGERLRKGVYTEADLILLDDYRQSFGEAYETVVDLVRKELIKWSLRVELIGRQAKTKTSIVQKLQRESIRLSQMQDIAGCRVVVPGSIEQELFARMLDGHVFEGSAFIDRRIDSSHGYRAIHIIARISCKPVEIQIRTRLQHQWAELSEKFSDFDPNIKYGGGDERAQKTLSLASQIIAELENSEIGLLVMQEGAEKEHNKIALESSKNVIKIFMEETAANLSQLSGR